MSSAELLHQIARTADGLFGSVDAGTDPGLVRYCAALENESLDRWRALGARELLQRLSERRLLLIGDHHRSPLVSRKITAIIAGLSARAGRLEVALECIPERLQGLLDLYLARSIEEAELRRALAHETSWRSGFALVRTLLRWGRVAGLGLVAIGSEAPAPRQRDAHMASALLRRLRRHPRRLLAVVVGESHLALEHLPGALEHSDPGLAFNRVLVNDRRGFDRTLRLQRRAFAFETQDNTFMVYNGSPIEKSFHEDVAAKRERQTAIERSVTLGRFLVHSLGLSAHLDPAKAHWFVAEPAAYSRFLRGRLSLNGEPSVPAHRETCATTDPLAIHLVDARPQSCAAGALLWLVCALDPGKPVSSDVQSMLATLARFLIDLEPLFNDVTAGEVDPRSSSARRACEKARRIFHFMVEQPDPRTFLRRLLEAPDQTP